MNTHLASRPSETVPINPDWTIAQLLEWLSDDVRQHDVMLQHPLARIEALMTGARWARTPSTVALIRSIAAAVRDEPVRGSIRVGELSPQQAPRMPERIPQPA
ncbi:hypothetical protein [Microbacterium sp.]|uniref:hypothetical protein n=1 Tax=Microbacterium sp. TaxID=51671 RepID=UPI0026038E55|nr:hypothetical protein [Microbacterium sp.]MCV0334209.1 hypothetical protein [Microbacterium sp.]MCV0374263.1 hypothetical protein [Microbacterium sp.]MCV0389335.1 hypothetical protein [Microbacterium sp.]MCV0418869.1 hypothetical protein [Microbacterium sp.]MCV0421175.1 hypothetical protein [Microbacterium sp.]